MGSIKSNLRPNNNNPPAQMIGNRYVFAAATPPPTQQNQYPPPPYYQYHRYYPLPPPMMPFVEHQKADEIKNDVNLRKETLRIDPDDQNPGKFLLSTLLYPEGEDCCLTSELHPPITVNFDQGLKQKFKQPSGTGIDFSMFEELVKVSGMDVYPLAVKAENQYNGWSNSQITQAVFDKDKGEYEVRVVQQILWVNGMRYELQEIFGIGNSVEDGEVDNSDPGKECVICLSEPRDTTVLPCRHMCMCRECAKVLRFQTNRCPICRQPVERLLEIKVCNSNDE